EAGRQVQVYKQLQTRPSRCHPGECRPPLGGLLLLAPGQGLQQDVLFRGEVVDHLPGAHLGPPRDRSQTDLIDTYLSDQIERRPQDPVAAAAPGLRAAGAPASHTRNHGPRGCVTRIYPRNLCLGWWLGVNAAESSRALPVSPGLSAPGSLLYRI